jgi:ABC-2 type transport system permease protein
LIIWRKEMRSYFVSPVAYLLLAMFAVIFGFFFWNILGYFVFTGMESQMRGEMFPMNLNEQVIRPLLSNVGVIGLFFIPMITMRLFSEEKRSGTIELLVPPRSAMGKLSPRKVAGGADAVRSSLLYGAQLHISLRHGNQTGSRWRSVIWACCCKPGALLAIGMFISTLTKNQIIAGAATFGAACLLWVLNG